MTIPEKLSHIRIDDFTYPLPDERIAKFPLETRDDSKLLISGGAGIKEDRFRNLAGYLPEGSTLVLNNTRVVHARLFFRKETGATIEVFCLEPFGENTEIQTAFQKKGTVDWRCLLGNARRWKSGKLSGKFTSGDIAITLEAENIEKLTDDYHLRFSWEPAEMTFAEVLECAGSVPLPPYLNRDAVASDNHQYQTVYAQMEGSVAAPTAGLHFTPGVFEKLAAGNINTQCLTLHVGAGTFKPVGKDGIRSHSMHSEQVIVNRSLLEHLMKNNGNVIAVGTTSVRTLESLYWFGLKLKQDHNAQFIVHQYDPYLFSKKEGIPVEEALGNILNHLKKKNADRLTGYTQMMIAPGYDYQVISGMVTNFHQPRSTLLLLIAAWLGEQWKEIYDYALKNDFRFLSYGDACLFL